MEGNLKEGENSSSESGGGYFSDKDKKFNLWYLSYGGDSNKERVPTPPKQNASAPSGSYNAHTSSSSGAGGGYVCFTAGHKVKLSDGTSKNIEDITTNDNVLTYDLETKKFFENTIKELSVRIVNKTIRITLENGITLRCTPEHPFYVKNKGWSSYNNEFGFRNDKGETKELIEGDSIFYYDDKKLDFINLKVSKIVELNKQSRVFNLVDVKGYNNFIVNNTFTHNK